MLNNKEITILSLHLGYGGIEQYLSSLCHILEDNYKINLIVTYKLSDKPAFNFSDNVNITYLMPYGPNRKELSDAIKHKNIFKLIKEGFKSIKILFLKRRLNIKAIKQINSKYIITTRSFHNSLVGKYAHKDIIKIATEHNHHNNDEKYIKEVVNSVKNFQYFVLVSKELTDFYKERVNGPKCIYIPNIIDTIPDKRSTLTKNNLIAVGRMEPVKGFDDLIDIIDIVKKDIPDIKLYLMGDGSQKATLENKVANLKLEDHIIFTGFVQKADMPKYFKDAKAYVMTSHSESFGLVLVEAMSYGLPCLAFDSARGAYELLKDNIGVLIPNRDKSKMAEEIIRLLTDRKKLSQKSDISYNNSLNYLPDKVKEDWLNILK